MNSSTICILIVIVVYLLAVLAIGFHPIACNMGLISYVTTRMRDDIRTHQRASLFQKIPIILLCIACCI